MFPEAALLQLAMVSGCVWSKDRTLGQGRAEYLQHGGNSRDRFNEASVSGEDANEIIVF